MAKEDDPSEMDASPPATSPARDDQILAAALSQAEVQALAERVMAMLKRDLQVERERLIGR